MASQIIKQPNGLYAVFNGRVLTYVDKTADELAEIRAQQAHELAIVDTQNAIRRAAEFGSSAYKPFAMTWESAYEQHLKHGGDDISQSQHFHPDCDTNGHRKLYSEEMVGEREELPGMWEKADFEGGATSTDHDKPNFTTTNYSAEHVE